MRVGGYICDVCGKLETLQKIPKGWGWRRITVERIFESGYQEKPASGEVCSPECAQQWVVDHYAAPEP
jgi:hypothetical protein